MDLVANPPIPTSIAAVRGLDIPAVASVVPRRPSILPLPPHRLALPRLSDSAKPAFEKALLLLWSSAAKANCPSDAILLPLI